MNMRTVACVSGLLGGPCWVARMVLERGGNGEGFVGPLYWVGAVLLLLALLGFGVGLVSKGATWLRAIVGVAFPALVWSVVEVLHPAGDPVVVDALAAIAVALVALLALLRHRDAPKQRRRAAGAHAR